MRREGSAFNGLGVVMLKELADHLTSIRFIILELIVMLIAVGTVYVATQQIKDTVAEDPFLFFKFFTTPREPLPSFIFWLSLLVLWLLVVGLGLLFIGIPPGGEEIARAFVFLLVTIVYAGVWLALALVFSIIFRSAATAALATLGLWLFFYVIWPVLAGEIAQIVVPPDPRYTALGLQTPGTVVLAQILARLSPSTLFGEIVVALLDPTTRALGPIYLSQLQGAVLGAPLPLGSSLLIAWPQIVGLLATAILLFVIGYVVFQRQEVRA